MGIFLLTKVNLFLYFLTIHFEQNNLGYLLDLVQMLFIS